MVGGVCAGLAEHFGIDTSIIRILAVVVMVLLFGVPILLYLVALIVIPRRPPEALRLIDVKPGVSGEFAQLQERRAAPGAAWVISDSQSFDAVEQEALEEEGRAGRSFWKRRGPSAALTLGFMLAGIGVFALLGTFIDPQFWAFWPFVVIVFGALTVFTPGYRGWKVSRAGNGVLLVSVGLVLLLWSFSFMPASAIVVIALVMWPFFLVSAGLIILGGALHKDLIKLIACLFLSLSLIIGAWTVGHVGGDYLVQLPFLPDYNISVPPSPIPWP